MTGTFEKGLLRVPIGAFRDIDGTKRREQKAVATGSLASVLERVRFQKTKP